MRRPTLVAGVATILCALATGCGGSSAPPKAPESNAPAPTASASAPTDTAPSATATAPVAPEPPRETAGPTEPAPPTVKLIAPGKDPKAELRYAPKPNQKTTLTMTMEMGMTMKMGEQSAPAVVVPKMVSDIVTQVTSVAPDGTISYDFKVENAKAIPAKNVAPEVLKQVDAAFAKIAGLKGHAVVDARGTSRDVQMEIPPDLDPAAGQMMETMRQNIQQFSNPLPEEPVGIGAKWDTEQRIPTNAMLVKQTTHSTLTARDGNKFTVKLELEQTADPQVMHLPGLPQGAEAKLVSLDSHGKGELKCDLARIAPVTSTVAIDSRSQMEISQNGQSLPMTMGVSVKVGNKSR